MFLLKVSLIMMVYCGTCPLLYSLIVGNPLPLDILYSLGLMIRKQLSINFRCHRLWLLGTLVYCFHTYSTYQQTGRSPVVFIISDSHHGDSNVHKLLPKDVQYKLGIHNIRYFCPVSLLESPSGIRAQMFTGLLPLIIVNCF